MVLANPPFKGSIDKGDINEDLKLKTTKIELLFVNRIINLLRIGGRSGVIVPDGVLFGSSKAHTDLRKMLVEECELQGVVSMRLLPHSSGKGRIPAIEVMVGTSMIRKLLHEGKTLELPQYIEQGGHVGMQTFNQALLRLYQSGQVTMEDALAYATSPDEFRLMAEGIASGVKAGDFDSVYR